MTKGSQIELGMRGFGDMLSRGVWKVPAYQRDYAWEKEHVARLFSDFEEALANGEAEYYLGSVVIKSNGVDTPEIVDGQQRIATTAVLMAAIRDHFFNKGDMSRVEALEKDYLFSVDIRSQDRSPKLTLNVPDNEFFTNTILNRPRESNKGDKPSKNRAAQDNIQAARHLAEAHVAKLAAVAGGESRIFDLIEYIHDKVRVIWVVVPDDSNAYMFFETLNGRGLDLAISDLLKNHLFRHAQGNLAVVQQHWIRMMAILENAGEDLAVDFIRHYWASTYGLTRDRQLYEEFKKRVTNKATALEFAQLIEHEASLYAAMLNPASNFWDVHTASSKDYMDILNRQLGMVRLRPLALSLLAKFKNKKELEKALRLLVNWSVRFLVTGGGAGTIELSYAQTAQQIRNGAVKTAPQLYGAMKTIVPTDEQFNQAFQIASSSKSKIARYYLRALERQALGASQPEWVPNENEDEINLEHVMPQTPEADWVSFDSELLRTYTKRLGNLALTKGKANSLMGNSTFAKKKLILATSTYTLTKSIANKTDWKAKEITERQKVLAALAVKAWPNKVS